MPAVACLSRLNSDALLYNNNHHATFHYASVWGRVNSDTDGSKGTYPVHRTYCVSPFTVTLMLRAADRTVSFAVNGVQQSGVWALPSTDVFHVMLATSGDYGSNIAVTEVTVTAMA